MKLPVKYSEIPYRERWKVRKAYIIEQEGICPYCKAPLNKDPHPDSLAFPVDESLFPKGFFKNSHHLHHCHETDLTIGVVHARCNALLWQYHGQ
jgi:hypothetical protein